MKIKKIGIVKNRIKKPKMRKWNKTISKIILNKKYMKGLDGIEEFSHLLIVFHLHKVKEFALKVYPQSRDDLPLTGIFATRTQFRVNPIGITIVELIERKENVLKVRGLDAIDNTPVIDIKPITNRDFVENVRVPKWVKKLGKL